MSGNRKGEVPASEEKGEDLRKGGDEWKYKPSSLSPARHSMPSQGSDANDGGDERLGFGLMESRDERKELMEEDDGVLRGCEGACSVGGRAGWRFAEVKSFNGEAVAGCVLYGLLPTRPRHGTARRMISPEGRWTGQVTPPVYSAGKGHGVD